MDKKDWTERLKGIKNLKAAAEFNKKKAEKDIEELVFMMKAIGAKIKTFK